MKIRKTGREPVEFCLLCTGDVCLRSNGTYYLKIEPTNCDVDGSYENAVKIETGELAYIESNELVTFVDCELVMKG